MLTWPDTVYLYGMAEYPMQLYFFRYRDPLTGRWRKSKYRATVAEIHARHGEHELLGEPMVIKGPITGAFSPFRRTGGES